MIKKKALLTVTPGDDADGRNEGDDEMMSENLLSQSQFHMTAFRGTEG
jgi:hypothetical protein